MFESLENEDEYENDAHSSVAQPVGTKDAGAILAREALEHALDRKSRRQLKKHPSILIVQVPDPSWAPLLVKAFSAMENAPVFVVATKPVNPKRSFEASGNDGLAYLAQGRSVLFISQDPDGILEPAVLAAADARINIDRLLPSVLRRAIRGFCGQVPRGVNDEMARLDLPVILSAMRPGWTARECVAALRRGIERRLPPRPVKGPKLEALPLTASVSTWASSTLALMREAEIDPSGAKVPFGVLEGPPGGGKTTIAGALAASANWTFVPDSVGNWFKHSSGDLGAMCKMAGEFFGRLRNANGGVVGFLDEIDSLPDRARMESRESSWWTPLVTLVLTEIDALRAMDRPVLLLGATNHFGKLDSALVRPQRLEIRVPVLLPDCSERAELFRHFLGSAISNTEADVLGRLTTDTTAAQIASLVQQAKSNARHQGRAVELRDVVQLIDPPEQRSADLDRAIAIHEAGHAVVGMVVGVEVLEISIIGNGDRGGHTRTFPPAFLTWEDVEQIVQTLLGGRAADMLLGPGANSGAERDLSQANLLLRKAMQSWGLKGTLLVGIPASHASRSDPLEEHQLGDELNRLLRQAIDIIDSNRASVEALARVLLRDRVLTGSRRGRSFREPRGEDQQESQRARQADKSSSQPLPPATGSRRPTGSGRANRQGVGSTDKFLPTNSPARRFGAGPARPRCVPYVGGAGGCPPHR